MCSSPKSRTPTNTRSRRRPQRRALGVLLTGAAWMGKGPASGPCPMPVIVAEPVGAAAKHRATASGKKAAAKKKSSKSLQSQPPQHPPPNRKSCFPLSRRAGRRRFAPRETRVAHQRRRVCSRSPAAGEFCQVHALLVRSSSRPRSPFSPPLRRSLGSRSRKPQAGVRSMSKLAGTRPPPGEGDQQRRVDSQALQKCVRVERNSRRDTMAIDRLNIMRRKSLRGIVIS